MEKDKQAYLILAHKDDFLFRTLLSLLDDDRNDIFVHMDKKNKKYEVGEIETRIKNSRIFHTERINVSWGGYSGIKAEILLLKTATSHGKYQHYHLLSGQDLPIKTQDEIIEFFERYYNNEFVRFQTDKFKFKDRVRYYYPLQECFGRPNKASQMCTSALIKLQKLIQIRRNTAVKFQKGTNWFSITDSFARYVVSNEKWISKTFKNTFCGDEIFLQTLLINSPFKENLFHKEFDNDCHAIMRLIDWTRGKPYIFKTEDLDEIKTSDMLFARKFDEKADSNVIEMIAAMVSK